MERKSRYQRLKEWLNIDHIVDLAVDLFLILFDVLSSPILIVMRLARWFVGKFMLDGLKNNIKKLLHWTKGKHPLLQIWIWTLTICIVAVLLVLMWLFGQAFAEFVMEVWGSKL